MADELVRRYVISPEEMAERYPSSTNARASWRANRRRNRAAGVDRFGRPLPRIAGTNPRARRTNGE